MKELIDKQAALDAVFNFAEHPDKAYQAIRQLPAVQSERNCDTCRFTYYAKSTEEDQEE